MINTIDLSHSSRKKGIETTLQPPKKKPENFSINYKTEVLIEKSHVNDPKSEASMKNLLDKLVGTVNNPLKTQIKPNNTINLFQ